MVHSHGGSAVAALALIGLLGSQSIGVGFLAIRSRVSAARYVVWGLFAAALGGAAFQTLHAVEHVAQLGYWIFHPQEAPWMTPWAMALVSGLAGLGGPSPAALGTELLHLIGNSIFFIGLVTLAVLIKLCAPGSSAARTTRITLWVQGFHVAEHLALTLTFVYLGRSAGVSTLLGLVEPGPALWTYRIWWHFAINLAATLLLFRALRQFWPERARIMALHTSMSGWAGPGHSAPPAHSRPRGRAFGPRLGAALRVLKQEKVTSAVAATVRVASAVAAVILIGNVVFVVFNANPDNSLVIVCHGVADNLVLFFKDLFLLHDPKIQVALNYGLAASAYFIIGQAVASLPGRRQAI